jgi:hypothetical protein
MKFVTLTIADVSTRHITKKDGHLLGSKDAPFAMAELHSKTGAIFYVPSKQGCSAAEFKEMLATMSRFGFSDEFQEIFRRLRRQGIPYVRFDADGADVEGAPEFNW